MEGESDTDTTSDSKSESDYDFESSTESDSLSENDSAGGNKRKLRPSSHCTPKKRRSDDYSQYLKRQIGNKSELPVTCGDKDGILHVDMYNDLKKCIFSEDQWFKPSEFERFGGKERSKKWKASIFCENIPLQKLIEAGLLSSFKKSQSPNKQIDSPDSSDADSPDSSTVANRLRKGKKQLLPSCSESNSRTSDDDNDITDMSAFEGSFLPVTCGSGSGILHKYRFATGRCGRCIRTKDFWLTPEDFIRLNKPGGMWRRDILSNGIPLGKLIMKKVLQLHMIACDCKMCKDQDQDLNDDVCHVCDSEGDLVCCDECPRAFHSLCHLPAVQEDSLGNQWSCTFCVMKKMGGSDQKTTRDVLSSPVSQYTLHCQYLLLHLLHESKTNVPGFSQNITALDRMKMNLANNTYQTVQAFVTDTELVFNSWDTSSEDSDLSRKASRLKEAFKREFETVFKLL
ncbi:nuclear body protein SP140-like protein isoform X2 [Puntigrus tetrazona]|uniref:nuclear body protein SP140-like protein isoform X2 n=1 Tax=Puntigrus tetrazona TaxID=1606681 RepID=UPI001C8A6340|nr:nuclear body protein SP140-like protein isoform X2 [Puntigrus tetrazona]